jgi:hypothetical protein
MAVCLTSDAITAASVLLGRIIAYNDLLDRANDPECLKRLSLQLRDIRTAWLSVCDACIDLKKISGFEVVLGGRGAVYHGYVRCMQMQLLDSSDTVQMCVTLDYPQITGGDCCAYDTEVR